MADNSTNWINRHRVLVESGCVFLCMIMIAVAGWLDHKDQVARKEREEAEKERVDQLMGHASWWMNSVDPGELDHLARECTSRSASAIAGHIKNRVLLLYSPAYRPHPVIARLDSKRVFREGDEKFTLVLVDEGEFRIGFTLNTGTGARGDWVGQDMHVYFINWPERKPIGCFGHYYDPSAEENDTTGAIDVPDWIVDLLGKQ